jgi:hypothetical protein
MAAAIIAAVALATLAIGLSMVFYKPGWFYRVSIVTTMVFAALNLGVVNLRWTRWVSSAVPEGVSEGGLAFPLWALNLLLGGIFAMILTSLICRARQSDHAKH